MRGREQEYVHGPYGDECEA